jgi:putative copper export protein
MLETAAALLKALLYAGLLTGSGAVLVQATAAASPRETAYLTKLMRRGAVLTLAACPLAALLLMLRLGGFDEVTLPAVFLSSSGAALCLQMTGAVLLLTSASETDAPAAVRVSYALLMMIGFAFSGHAASVGPVEGFVAVLHASAAAWWLGSLCYLRFACSQLDLSRVIAIVARFSSIAFVVTGALVLAGLTLIMILVDFSADAWLQGYGQILAIKLVIAGSALGLAALNRWRLTPRLLAGDAAAVATLQRRVVAEIAALGAILVITAILTTYVSPHEEVTQEEVTQVTQVT